MFGFRVPCGENRETSENLVRTHRCKMSVIAIMPLRKREGGDSVKHQSEDLPEAVNVRFGKSALLCGLSFFLY